jgi:hypothetical protein
MSVRFLALLAAAALAFAPSNASAGLFGCCHSAPSCGCEAAPSCGCEVAPSCGCEVAPACDPCARPSLFSKLRSKLHSFGSCCKAPSCGCEVAPSCGCEIAAPSCGCEIAAPCCDPCAPRHKLLGGLKSRLSAHRGCFAAPSCGCDAAPSCGCEAAPSCGCGM